MFDCVHGGGFSSKCKSRIKLIRSRINVIKKRRSTTVGYLKNDIAELLKNGLDINAYGRAEGLISELTRLSCYELIDQFCGCILEKLSSMRKQRDCPPESKEAVSSLMFAAARFADLPELRDLRCIFTGRYGNAMESAINQEFAEKIESRPPSMDQKLQLMRNLSREFSINWDSKAFRARISNPITSACDRSEKCESLRKGKDGAVAKIDKDNAIIKVEMSSYERQERTPTRNKMKTDNSKVILPITSTGDDCPPFGLNKSGHKGPAENLKPHCTNNVIPPYVKTKGSKYGTDLEICHSGSDHSKSTDLSIINRDIACYKQEKTQVGSNEAVHEKQLVGPVAMSSGSGDENDYNQDNSVVEAQLKLKSVRRKKNLKMLVHENYATTEDNELVRRNPNGRRSQGIRRGIRPAFDDHHDEEDMITVHKNYATREDNEPVSRNPNGRRSQGIRRVVRPTFDDYHDEEDVIMDELLIHYSKKSSTPKGSRAPKGLKAPAPAPASHASKSPLHPTKIEARLNSEPKGLKALVHASDATKSPLHQNKEESRLNSKSSFPPPRVASLPPQRTTPTEVVKGPGRSASLEPNMLGPHVHPKLPDYDDLAARFAALRGERGK